MGTTRGRRVRAYRLHLHILSRQLRLALGPSLEHPNVIPEFARSQYVPGTMMDCVLHGT